MITSNTPEKKDDREGFPGVSEGLPSEECERLQKLQAKLSDFVLRLIQAFLRTGYYTPDHPESKKAKEGLSQLFRDLFEGDDELTFLLREEQGGQEILVEGVLPEAQKLSRMMMKGMGELYVPKFAKYLERKDLIALTLKSRMNQTEFTRFVDIMSEPTLVDTHRKQDKDRFVQTLCDQEIFDISFVFNEELLVSDREMPWRARLTLSRMKKDLKIMPHFQKMGGQALKVIKKGLLRDALRPVRQSDLYCSVLRNSDLAVSSESGEEFIEDEIISFLEKQFLWGTSKIFLREHLALKQLQKGDEIESKSDRLVKKISHRLKEVGTKEGENLLEEFFQQGLIGLEDLTSGLKDRILLQRLTDKFLNYTDQFFQKLDQAQDKEAFLNVAHAFVRMIPELIQRDRYTETLRILETLNHHFHQKKMWALLAGQVVEEIGQGEIPQMLKQKFLTGKKESRAAIVPIFVSLEIGAISPLLSVLKTSDDQWVRKNACEALIQIGPVAAVHLLKELEAGRTPVETTCDVLRVLREIKSPQWKTSLMNVLTRLASHEHPRLREQAIHTLFSIGGPEGEGIFLASLEDTELEVQKRAVWCLGMIKSVKGIEKMMEILKEISGTPSPKKDTLETQIYHAFGTSGNLTIHEKTLEDFLLHVVEQKGIRRWFTLVEKRFLSEAALEAICETLGKIGTKKSIKILTRLGKSHEGLWIPKVKEALKKIEERTEGDTREGAIDCREY